MKVDVHAHLAGVGAGGSGCWLSPAFARRWTFRFLRRWLGVTDVQMRATADADWAAALAERVRGSGLDAAVALGFDGVYAADGTLDQARSQMVVPPAWVFEVCRRHPELLPGPAVNPHRRDALEVLDECIARGAVLVKWLPSAMGIDPSDPRIRPFYRRMADAGLPLLVHSGGSERTFAEVDSRLKDLRLLELPLAEGVPVVVAHAGVPVLLSGDEDQRPLLRAMLRRHRHLWVDNSGIANPSRFPHLPTLAEDAEMLERTLYGSDYPVPSNAVWYVHRLGPVRVATLERERNPLRRDVELKRALGFPDATLTRASEVLPTLSRLARPADGDLP
ncbi:MAG: metal-dependent hydrolase superfamily protein [Gemmatimonadetes bacterium]|nr:metal-dependent hydrolase superfamily protein [Gemmatimonadota bacterium]